MRGDARSMTVVSPRDAAEALTAYARDPKLVPIAGGTDLMVVWNLGQLNGRAMLDLSRVKAWRGIRKTAAGLELGSLVTHAELRDHPLVRGAFPLLSAACATVGAAAIQNRGTIGGNIANASPAGDSFPALAVYEALVRVAGPSGRRELPIMEVFAGVKKTTLKPGELIESVLLPPLPRRPDRVLFRKVGTRAAQAISKTMFAGLLWLKKDGTVEEARLSFGSMAPTVRRLRAAEAFLQGRPLNATVIPAAAEMAGADLSPIDDIRSTREYRLRASRGILSRFLQGDDS